MQVKLLRVLQEGEIERLGGTGAVAVDVRVVAATHVDLQERVRAGTFREDLYYRLDVVTLHLPPLREREGDIAVLAPAWLAIHAARHGRSIDGFEPRALLALSTWRYPGNVRELSHAIERAVVLCPDGSPLRFDDLPPAIKEHAGASTTTETLTFRVGQMTLPQMERAAIDATMAFAQGDKVQAAKLLGVSLRTLYRRLDEKPGVEHDDG
jgi:two-component system response regulator HydG